MLQELGGVMIQGYSFFPSLILQLCLLRFLEGYMLVLTDLMWPGRLSRVV